MSRTTRLLLIAITLGASPTSIYAQWRCDCTTIVDRCTAQVAARQNWIDVTTDSKQCARVDYFVDGLPFVTTVVEGQHRLDWMTPRANPNILIQSCQVCADNAMAATGRFRGVGMVAIWASTRALTRPWLPPQAPSHLRAKAAMARSSR